MKWLIVSVYLAVVLSAVAWMSYRFLKGQPLSIGILLAMFVIIVVGGWLGSIGLDRVGG